MTLFGATSYQGHWTLKVCWVFCILYFLNEIDLFDRTLKIKIDFLREWEIHVFIIKSLGPSEDFVWQEFKSTNKLSVLFFTKLEVLSIASYHFGGESLLPSRFINCVVNEGKRNRNTMLLQAGAGAGCYNASIAAQFWLTFHFMILLYWSHSMFIWFISLKRIMLLENWVFVRHLFKRVLTVFFLSHSPRMTLQ